MNERDGGCVVVAHRRSPVLRMIRTALAAEGWPVRAATTAPLCLAALLAPGVAALVLDADLVRRDSDESERLYAALLRAAAPTLIVSWEPSDRLLARTLGNAPFLSRLDDIERIVAFVRQAMGEGIGNRQ